MPVPPLRIFELAGSVPIEVHKCCKGSPPPCFRLGLQVGMRSCPLHVKLSARAFDKESIWCQDAAAARLALSQDNLRAAEFEQRCDELKAAGLAIL